MTTTAAPFRPRPLWKERAGQVALVLGVLALAVGPLAALWVGRTLDTNGTDASDDAIAELDQRGTRAALDRIEELDAELDRVEALLTSTVAALDAERAAREQAHAELVGRLDTMAAQARTQAQAVRARSASTSSTPAPATTQPAGGRSVRSTAYCLTGNMASGKPTYVGAVAGNAWPLGTVLIVSPHPWGTEPRRFVVEDRHKAGATELDFAMPRECDRALAWGNRKHVTAAVAP